MIVIVFGLPGSGKSYFASRLAEKLRAEYVSSDRVRNAIYAYKTYSEKEKSQVYDEMLKQMQEAVKQQQNMVLDATFYSSPIRHRFSKVDEGIVFIEIIAQETLIRERLQKRRTDSDADFEVYRQVKEQWESLDEPHLVLRSTDNNIEDMLQETLQYLQLTDDRRTGI